MFPPFISGTSAGGLLLLRLIAGSAFILHGLQKYQSPGGPFAWMGRDANVPGIMQALAVAAELGGGAAWILGLLTPVACLGILCTMVTAITTFHLPHNDPFVGAPGKPSYELAMVYLGIAVTLLVVGPGTVSFDALIFGRKRRDDAEFAMPVEESEGPANPAGNQGPAHPSRS
jgi:putative oxidoreductase